MARRKSYPRETMPNYVREDQDINSSAVKWWEMRQTLRGKGIQNPTYEQVTRAIQRQDKQRKK